MCLLCNTKTEVNENDTCPDAYIIQQLEQNINDSDMPSWMFET